MKILAFIMAILILALSVMPCADKDAPTGKDVVKAEIAKADNHHHNPMQDNCSPFCHCTCCAGFSINHFVTSIAIIPSYESTTKTAYLPVNILDVALPVWQPPQLV